MDRREFFKLFGKGAAITAVTATVGLPEFPQDEVKFVGNEYLDRFEPELELGLDDGFIISNDTFCICGQFTSCGGIGTDSICTWSAESWSALGEINKMDYAPFWWETIR